MRPVRQPLIRLAIALVAQASRSSNDWQHHGFLHENDGLGLYPLVPPLEKLSTIVPKAGSATIVEYGPEGKGAKIESAEIHWTDTFGHSLTRSLSVTPGFSSGLKYSRTVFCICNDTP